MTNLPLFLLDILPTQKNAPFGERIVYGGKMLLVGLLIVFSVLVILWLALELFGLIVKRLDEKNKKAAPVTETVAPVTKETDDLQLIAILTAAIAASESAPAARFRVVSFKRK